MARHSGCRKAQMNYMMTKEHGAVVGSSVQGMAKRYQKMSVGQLRNMFPAELIGVPDHEVLARGIALLKQREKAQQ